MPGSGAPRIQHPATSASSTTPLLRRRSTSQNLTGRPTISGQPPGSPTFSNSPSLIGLLASKKLARQFASRVYARRAARSSSLSSKYGGQGEIEPTYQMEPKVRFDAKNVEAAMADIVGDRMKGFQYSPRRAVMMCKILTEEIKVRVKEMNFDRYKLVCVVSIGETQGQGLRVTSRCTWDPNTDSSATYSWRNGLVFCTATMFALYRE